MQPPKFSVCVICKNMARTIPRLAASISEFLQRGGQWVLVDTGSTDGSADVARSLGAEVTEVGERFMITIDAELAQKINERFVVGDEQPIVQPGSRLFDFASARNFGASLAVNDWVSWADADEAFTTLDIDKINEIISDPELVHLEYEFCFAHDAMGNAAVQFVQSKFYRHIGELDANGKPTKRMRWAGAVHEILEAF